MIAELAAFIVTARPMLPRIQAEAWCTIEVQGFVIERVKLNTLSTIVSKDAGATIKILLKMALRLRNQTSMLQKA